MGFGQAISHFQRLVLGKVAAYDIFAVIDRESKIDGLSTAGKAPSDMQGVVELKDVHFAYPSAPDEKVLKGMLYIQTIIACSPVSL
jgi:ABC-type multidrug transport system fused ATPase/permease subunit